MSKQDVVIEIKGGIKNKVRSSSKPKSQVKCQNKSDSNKIDQTKRIVCIEKKDKQEQLVQKTAEYVKSLLSGDATGHDWWHVYRVWKMAKKIGDMQEADLFIVELAAILHDIADWKFTGGDETVAPRLARSWLESLGLDEHDIVHICKIIKNLSFKGADVETKMDTIEGMVVQDADRLDAIGAIGIARCFSYGGYKNNLMHDPDIKPVMHKSAKEYIRSNGTSLNHFYEKLLLLKDRMNTSVAAELAQKRHDFMLSFLEEFFSEWDGTGI